MSFHYSVWKQEQLIHIAKKREKKTRLSSCTW